jgi:hypothetical protein
MEKHDARQYLITKGFKVGQRGRFSSEQIQVLKDSGLTFTRPIRDPKPRTKVNAVPLA